MPTEFEFSVQQGAVAYYELLANNTHVNVTANASNALYDTLALITVCTPMRANSKRCSWGELRT